MYVTFGVDISIVHVCILMFWFLKNKFDFNEYLQRIPNAISDQNLFTSLQSCCRTAIQKNEFKISSLSGDISFKKKQKTEKTDDPILRSCVANRWTDSEQSQF